MATTFAVPDGRVAMAATLYTGNGSTQSISNDVNTVSFQPDFVWIKSRNQATNHALFDSVRGTGKVIQSNTTAAEATDNTTLTAFNASGFSLGAAAGSYIVNTSTYTFVGWNWKAGGTAVSNTAGTITSSVSANTTAGFSVVTYTGTGVNATVGHGLGVAPGMFIIKSRSVATNWIVYHSSVAATAHLVLNITDAAYTDVAFNNTAPTSSVFSIGPTGYSVNNSAATYVAYCWAPVAGYSAFGSYTGNGSADGPFIYTGFRPRWILIKSSTVATSWYLLDSARETYNEEKIFLYPDLAQADSPQSAGVDFLSNGFKVRAGAGLGINNASGGYIYAAFAENPLKYANAR
jgi:hypothetical protein